MVILGGMGNVWGVIAGAAFLAYLNTEGLAEMGGWMNDNVLHCGGGAGGGQGDLRRLRRRSAVSFGIYGIILVVVMLVSALRALPRGAAEAGVRGRRPRRAARWTCAARRRNDDGRAAPPDGCAAQGVRRTRRGERRRLHDPAGLHREPDRPERRRQDDVLQHDHRRLQGDVRRGRVRRRGHHGPACRTSSRSAGSGARSRTSGCSRR